MRISGKRLRILGVAAGVSAASAALTMGACGGDTGTTDGGDEAGPDAIGPDVQADVTADVVGTPDATDAGDASDVNIIDLLDAGDAADVNVFQLFRANLTSAYCTRLEACCGLDAGNFDLNACQGYAAYGWDYSNAELSNGVLQRGDIAFDNSAAVTCVNDISNANVFTCPTLTSANQLTLANACYDAVVGTLDAGEGCIASIECKPGEYCKFDGVDGGTTDAGNTLGECAALLAQGSSCGQGKYGPPNYQSDECSYKSWQSPALFCKYTGEPDASTYKCTALSGTGATCYFDNECLSGLCTGTCATSLDESVVCPYYTVKDAGND